jgi:S-(hydroxymethyl)glutathione dehydrogenase/alcohol dehydrogenase
MKAAVMRTIGEPLRIEQLQIDGPGPREVLVRTAAGVCHSDLHVLEGSLPSPLPTVLGHEPAGVVEAVGNEVRYVAPGDHVIGCLSVFCGTCEYCIAGRPNLCEGAATVRRPDEPPRLAKDGEPIAQFAHLSAFAERMLVHENALVRIRPDVPLDRVALIGCGVTTGLGAVFNTARVRAGATVAIIGCGGIGLSVVQGCRIAGAGRIVAIDTVAWKLELAARLGATDGVNAAEGNPVPPVVEMSGGGVDYAFEALGTPATVRQAVRMTRRGGTSVMIGVVPMGTNVELPGADIVLREKTILGCMMGSNRFRVDMPRYVELYRKGLLRLDEMISARLPLERVNDAFEALRRGTAARSVVVFES